MITAAASPAREALLEEPAGEAGPDASAGPSAPERQHAPGRNPDDEDFAPQPLPPRDPEVAARFDAWWNGMLPEQRELLEEMAQTDKLRHHR